MSVSTIVKSFEDAEQWFLRLFDPLANPTMDQEHWRATVDELSQIHSEFFASSSGPDGTPWAPLSARRIRQKGHDRILIDTDRLAESLTGPGEDAIRVYGSTYLEFGTRREWAWTHQFGTDTIPQRIHTGIPVAKVDAVVNQVGETLVEMLAAI